MKILIGLAIGVGVTAIFAYFVCDSREALLEVQYMSQIEAPIRLTLEDILATYDSGDSNLAESKVRRFEELWQQYWETRMPIDFNGEVSRVRGVDR